MKCARSVQLTGILAAVVLSVCSAGCDRLEQAGRTSTTAGSGGAGIDDGILSAKLAAALLAELRSRSYGFEVEAHEGAVRLNGYGQSQADIDRAVEVLRRMDGVKTVDNQASVKAPDPAAGARVDDAIITARVKSRLVADAGVRGLSIGVATNRGEVQLSGFVDAPSQGERAVEVARGAEGVRAVDNRMQVRK